MELLCPHCLKRVTVSDDRAGQVLNCPLCSGVFAAPSLPSPASRSAAPPPAAPPPAPPPPVSPPRSESPVPFQMEPVAPPPPPVQPSTWTTPPAPPPPPPPVGDYSHQLSMTLRPDVLVCVPAGCIFLIVFVFSFFARHVYVTSDSEWMYFHPRNLWQLSFSGTGLFLAYLLFMMLALPLSVACVIFEKRWLPTPPPLV